MPVINKTALKSAISSVFATTVVNTDVITQLHDIVDSYEDFIPSLTQVQINALTPVVSQIVFNADLGQLQYYDGSQWQYLASTSDAIMSVTRTLTSAEILALFTTPITLIPAQGANRVIAPIELVYQYNYGETAYDTNGEPINILFLGSNKVYAIGDSEIEGSVSLIGIESPSGVLVANTALSVQAQTANPTLGNGTLTITIYYRVITV